MDTVQKVRDFYMCFGNGFDKVHCRGCHVKKTCDKEARPGRTVTKTIFDKHLFTSKKPYSGSIKL